MIVFLKKSIVRITLRQKGMHLGLQVTSQKKHGEAYHPQPFWLATSGNLRYTVLEHGGSKLIHNSK